jgi:hypothetical protein
MEGYDLAYNGSWPTCGSRIATSGSAIAFRLSLEIAHRPVSEPGVALVCFTVWSDALTQDRGSVEDAHPDKG